MTRQDYRIIFTALGFHAVITGDNVPRDKQAARATSIARLIESFCITSVPDAFEGEDMAYSGSAADTERLVDDYITSLRDDGSASLDYDRNTLLKMYEVLTVQKLRHEQKEFYAHGCDDIIASKVLRLAEEQIGWEVLHA